MGKLVLKQANHRILRPVLFLGLLAAVYYLFLSISAASSADPFLNCDEVAQNDLRPSQDVKENDEGRALDHGWIGANRILPGCWTYQDRTILYEHRLSPALSTCMATKPQSRTAFMVRIDETQKWTKDFTMSIRALLYELKWRKNYDIHILQHITGKSPAIPDEFRSITTQFVLEDLVKDYEKSIIDPIPDPPVVLPIIAQYNHMSETWFMRRHRQYEFVWFSEGDVRLTGPWDVFLTDVELEMMHAGNIKMDLVNFGPHFAPDKTWHWANSLHQFPQTNWTMSLLQLHRVSKALANAMHDEHAAGRNAYFESFIPTVATKAGLNKFVYANAVFSDSKDGFDPHPFKGIACITTKGPSVREQNLYYGNMAESDKRGDLFCHGTTYSPSRGFAPRYYKDWMDSSSVCRPISLVHPVK